MALRKQENLQDHFLKQIANDRNWAWSALYEKVKDHLVSPRDGSLMGEEAFRGHFNRGHESNWLKDAVKEALEKYDAPVGQPLKERKSPRLRMIGVVGAGGDPSNDSFDEYYLDAPAEFCQPGWRGFVVDSGARSMIPYIQPGDTVVSAPDKIAKLKRFMILQDDNDPTKLYVKQVLYANDQPIFVSTNLDSPPLNMAGLSVAGRVVGIISADGKLKIGPYEPGITEAYIREALGSRL